ncbi:hypothetical protein CspeluHIS016_0201400 [Cutaneotrichosporon spelunceum]|uniref:MYND-type domain-containing protein n=1 Tax=Cutaneotrichosporon spelunceum TaxID=1672016 RepID=A0AAD3TR23_9TREE|nr:hypothetical protein CspeluHIS016_0201400 [Cutaneotrichosporon spelunceum]
MAATDVALATTVPDANTPIPAAVDLGDSEEDVPKAGGGKKKKKKPKKKKAKPVPPDFVPVINETAAETAAWEAQLVRGAKTFSLPPWLLNERERPKLDLLRTPSCIGFALHTPRLILRQVSVGDTAAIRRIKTEPVVQRTQLYGSPAASDIRDSFQRRYVASSIPSLERGTVWRDEWVFAITARDPASLKIAPGTNLKVASRIKDAEGYLGNFALSLSTHPHAPPLLPTAQSGLEGKLFYELHPQLWGQGLASEAFGEVLRFAFEEVGCVRVSADPTTDAVASIALCLKFGMRFAREENRTRPVITCKCGWAKYCSRECQRADWVWRGGHQSECDAQ